MTVDSRVSGVGSSEPTISSASSRAVTDDGSAISTTVLPERITVIASATVSTSSSLCEMKITVDPSSVRPRRLSKQLVDFLGNEDCGRFVEDQDPRPDRGP